MTPTPVHQAAATDKALLTLTAGDIRSAPDSEVMAVAKACADELMRRAAPVHQVGAAAAPSPVAIDALMEQAQVFASAWSLVGGQFDMGQMLGDAEDAKAELRQAITAALVAALKGDSQ